MEYVAEVTLEEDEESALEAGLLDDVDELLNEDDNNNATSYPPNSSIPQPPLLKTHRSGPSFTNPFSPQIADNASLSTPRVSLESPSGRKLEGELLKGGRNSEEVDHWEGNFSDFEEPEEGEEDDDDNQEDEEKVVEKVKKPGLAHTISMEKRMD